MMKTILAAIAATITFTAVSSAAPSTLTPKTCLPFDQMAETMNLAGYEAMSHTLGEDGNVYTIYFGDDDTWMLHVTDGSVECHLIGGQGIVVPLKGDPA